MFVYLLDSDDGNARLKNILGRRIALNDNAATAANEIIVAVAKEGDAALFRYTKQYDRADICEANIRVTQEEIAAAYKSVGEELVGVIRCCHDRILGFHQKQLVNSWITTDENGGVTGQLVRPLDIVGVYVPGGKAAYPSTVLMNLCPAKAAGVGEIIICTPPDQNVAIDPAILVAADICGVTAIYKAGGAQAIAAMAYGTKCVPGVDMIVGPGNAYVAMAKKAVFGRVGIDSIAGPSEILIIADDSAKAAYIAADMLSQAEHDEAASAVLITTSKRLAEEVESAINKQTAALSRRGIIEKSLKDFGAAFIVDSLDEAVIAANDFAPEHLELCVRDSQSIIYKIKNAGAIFVGDYSPEPIGDYAAGPNHVLPTGGTARFFSPLSADSFLKKTSVISYTKEAFEAVADDVIRLAGAEGLTAHAASVAIRAQAAFI